MRIRWFGSLRGVMLALILIVLVGGCDRAPPPSETVGLGPHSPEERLKQRVEGRWVALESGDLAAAYEYESPGYRATVSLPQFTSQFGTAVRWLDTEVESIDVSESGDRAEVTVMLDYEAPDALGDPYTGRRPIPERWIASDGDWWYVRN